MCAGRGLRAALCSAKVVGVFQRFTDGGRQVIVLAQSEARALGHLHIGTEHLLLGLLRQEHGVAAQVLATLGVELDEARAVVVRTLGEAERGRPLEYSVTRAGPIPFTPRAKKVLELSLREALALGHNLIDTEHVLLGLVREGEGVANHVLDEMCADAATIHDEIVSRLPPARRWRERRWGQWGPPSPARWEYRIERPDPPGELTPESLNGLGELGWELVSVLPAEMGGGLVFKRRVHVPPAPPAAAAEA
jgi:hypothetical protein